MEQAQAAPLTALILGAGFAAEGHTIALRGAGVDVVLNSLTNDGFVEATVRATAPNGRFAEIAKRDIWTPEQMAAARPDIAYEIVALDVTTLQDPGHIHRLLTEVSQGLGTGEWAPLPAEIYPITESRAAFRRMQQARHIGKIVVQIPHPLQPRPDHSYLVTGGLGAIGLHTAAYLAQLGAGDIVLTSVTQGNGATASAMIYAYKSDSLEIIDHKFYFTRLEGYLDVHFEDLGEEELSQEVDARSGKKMILKLKPGLPLGDFNEAIRITTNLPDSPRIDIAIQGIVTPDITFLASKRFHRGQRVLDLGIVSQEKGVEEKVMLLAKGPLRESIKFRVKEIEPVGVFQVEIVRRDSSATSKALQHAVVIKVPEGISQIKRLNPQQEGYGRILLETTHPDIEELEILVRFAIVPTEK